MSFIFTWVRIGCGLAIASFSFLLSWLLILFLIVLCVEIRKKAKEIGKGDK